MSLAAIEALLKQTMGLDVHTMGESSIQRAAQRRLEQLGRDEDYNAYYGILHQSQAELQALIEEIVVPETWFFRDQRPFEAFKRMILEEWLSQGRSDPLRILSIPCSTGEEPYSIAMALHMIGFPPEQARIEGVDISMRNLERAARARYRNNSFRGQDLAFRQRFFTPVEDEFQLDEHIRRRVHFSRGNLLSPLLLQDLKPYDVVFCRNLLIYFDRATQDQAQQILRRLLTDNGILFIGHAEAGLFLDSWEASSRYPGAFAFRKCSDERRTRERPDPALPRRKKPQRTPLRANAPKATPSSTPRIVQNGAGTTAAAALATDIDQLGAALRLANQGHLAEAAELCEQHLRVRGPSAEAFYLLGLVREATGQSPEAESFWRKALYLQPQHIEALTHLALLCERRGDQREAQLLRQRTERALINAGGGKT